MTSDPYGPDDDEAEERPNIGSPYRVGVQPVAVPRQGAGVPLKPANPRAVGVALTALPYDPRTAAGVMLTRLSYDPRSFAGSTGQALLPEDVAKSHIERSGTVPEWVAPWLYARAQGGEYPPAWAERMLASRGRPDLAAYCQALASALSAEYERRKGA